MSKKVVIVGAGIGGLGTANLLAKLGYQVTVVEKNAYLGGRAGVIKAKGYTFDKGPSWYLMPDIFEHYFELCGKRVADYLQLAKLAPSYRVFFEGAADHVDFFSDIEKTAVYFESLEIGAGEKFRQYMVMTGHAYATAKKLFIYKNYDSVLDLFDPEARKAKLSPRLLGSMHRYISREFKSERIQKILQYQLVFLGGSPYNTPALYSIMNYIDFSMGVQYPAGGIYSIVEALVAIGKEFGVRYLTNSPVQQIIVAEKEARGVVLNSGEVVAADLVISNADIHFTESELLPQQYRQKSEKYWQKRTLAPSAFIMYLGVRDRVPELTHHNLLFAKDWKQNFSDIFDRPQFPEKPSVYICAPSVTDPTVAPPGKENLFVLAPIAPGLSYTKDFLITYGNRLLDWMGDEMGISQLRDRIEFRQDYCVEDFVRDYNSYKGTALGLAHTLRQSVFLRPNNVSNKVSNLYYVGANTNPGIGMPICLISAELVIKRIMGDTGAGPLVSLPKA